MCIVFNQMQRQRHLLDEETTFDSRQEGEHHFEHDENSTLSSSSWLALVHSQVPSIYLSRNNASDSR